MKANLKWVILTI